MSPPGCTEKSPTIYDVAKTAGVAPSTVSRTFARPGLVNADTAERVREAAARLGYRTSPVAKARSRADSRLVTLVVADVTNPFNFAIIRGAESAAMEAGYTLLVADTQESDRREREILDRVVGTFEGVMLASPRISDSALRMIAKQVPTMVLNRAVPDVPSVVTDIGRGMRRAMEHLAGLGHLHVTYVAGPEASWTDGMRWRAMREAGIALGLTVRRIGPFGPTIRGGGEAAAVFAAQPASAAIAYNDLTAIGLMRGLQERGVAVPDEVSVVGFDDIFAADLVAPGLTTVAAPLHDLGARAAQNLIAIIGGARVTSTQPIEVPTRLVVRNSTVAPVAAVASA